MAAVKRGCYLLFMNEARMPHEPTTSDILEVIQDFATKVDERFDRIENTMAEMVTKDQFEKRLAGIDGRLTGVEGRLTRIETTMVTKDYLDDKLGDLRGDLILLARKQNKKLSEVVMELRSRNVFDEETAKRLLEAEPFPST